MSVIRASVYIGCSSYSSIAGVPFCLLKLDAVFGLGAFLGEVVSLLPFKLFHDWRSDYEGHRTIYEVVMFLGDLWISDWIPW